MHCRTEKAIDQLVYRLRVKVLEKQGKPYRPMDFALSLNVDDTEEEEHDSKFLTRGRRSHSLASGLGNTVVN